MLIIILVIIGLSLLILGHEAGHFFAAKLFGLKVDEFGIGFPPRITAWKKGETEYSVNWLPFGGFVKISGEQGEFALLDADHTTKDGVARENAPSKEDIKRSLYAQPAWKKSIIMLAGVFMNFILGWIFLSLTLMIGAPQALVITGVQPSSPAAAAGIMSNDLIKGYVTAQSFIDFINAHAGVTTTVSVIRNDKELDFNITPRVTVTPDEGRLGVSLEEAGQPREAFFAAIRDGLINAGILLWLTLGAFWQLITQLFVHASLLPGVVGPVGIFGVAEETGKIGLVYLLQLLGIISLNLTIVNLVPFPALDGGRFVMAIIEKIKGSPISPRVEALINGLGFAFLILLMVLLTVRDIKGLI
jgi:regulator of sigma E protease